MTLFSRSRKSAFTLVEVSLFIALTGVLLTGVIVATQGSVSRQRFADSTQDLADYLREAYSAVFYVQNSSVSDPGRTDIAIYGKMLTFGEECGSSATCNSNQISSVIYSYDIVGNAISASASADYAELDPLTALTSPGISAHIDYTTRASHLPLWGASVENTGASGDNTLFRGALLIIHSPVYGTVYTYTLHGSVIPSGNVQLSNYVNTSASPRSVYFSLAALDLCLDSPDRFYALGTSRRNIRVARNGRNSSAVQLLEVDDSDNACR